MVCYMVYVCICGRTKADNLTNSLSKYDVRLLTEHGSANVNCVWIGSIFEHHSCRNYFQRGVQTESSPLLHNRAPLRVVDKLSLSLL